MRNCGPMGGIYTALLNSKADWNLIVACDMPGVTPDFLRGLLTAASGAGKDCVVCAGPRGPAGAVRIHPLCGVYHARILPALDAALKSNQLKMQDFVARLNAEPWPVADASVLRNINTPEEFEREVA